MIRGLAYQRDLYTIVANEQEFDDFERWIHTEFEQPAEKAIASMLAGERLKREDWHALVKLLASQDLRTPRNFLESTRRWKSTMPEVLERILQESVKEIAQAKKQGRVLVAKPEQNEFSGLIRGSVEQTSGLGSDEAYVKAEITLGRQLWISSMRHLLRQGRPIEALLRHQWSIAEPAGEEEWPLTDHPVLKLNYQGPGRYDFGGGWKGKRGTEIMMPLSPRHLLYVHVGRDDGRRVRLSPDLTKAVQRLLIERAHRWVFATQPLQWVAKVKPRTVDAEAFAAEKEAWQGWHQDQSRAEMSSA